MTILAALLSLLTASAATATRYADTARDEGGTPACARRLPRETYRAMHPIRCAHRTLPCGTLLRVWTPRGSATCAVLDRGPWGLRGARRGVGQGRWSGTTRRALLRLARRDPGAFRGDLDLSPLPASRIGLTPRVGRMPVLYWVVGR